MPYTVATLKSKDALPSGQVQLMVEFTGSGEPPIRQGYVAGATTTIADIKDWANTIAANLNAGETLIAALPNVGATVQLQAKTPPSPSAQDVWNEKAARLQRMKALPVTNAAATTDINTLQADVNATYQAGFIAGA